MKRYCVLIILLLLSLKGFGNPFHVSDTIAYWQVYYAGQLLEEGNIISHHVSITLDKKKILATDTLTVKYFDDTPCTGCSSAWIIKTKKGAEVGKFEKTGGTYVLTMLTADLQALVSKNRRTPLLIYFRKDETDREILLFEIGIR